MPYKHGVYVGERATSVSAPDTGNAAVPVVVGTAPVYMAKEAKVNEPILVETFEEAKEFMGYSSDFASFTLCEAVNAFFKIAKVSPIVLINVADPKKHNAVVSETPVSVVDGRAVVTVQGMMLEGLTVKNASVLMVETTDYVASYNENGNIVITVVPGGKGADASSLNISGKKFDASKVKAEDIVGAVDSESGTETGIEAIRKVFPKLNVIPGVLLAPRYSMDAKVAAALQAKTENINGAFKSLAIIDIKSDEGGAKKYRDVKGVKDTQGISSANAYAIWPFVKVGGQVYSGSSVAAAVMSRTDMQNDGIPYVSPSNKGVNISGICLADGTEVVLDLDQANVLNGEGVATFINVMGFRLWGNNTAAYPGTKDPKDRWVNVRRFMNWAANTFIVSYFERVDNPANKRQIEAIVDSENVRGNAMVSMGACARYELVYNPSDNTEASLLDGVLRFHQYIAPYIPAEVIENVIEFDPEALVAALNG